MDWDRNAMDVEFKATRKTEKHMRRLDGAERRSSEKNSVRTSDERRCAHAHGYMTGVRTGVAIISVLDGGTR